MNTNNYVRMKKENSKRVWCFFDNQPSYNFITNRVKDNRQGRCGNIVDISSNRVFQELHSKILNF